MDPITQGVLGSTAAQLGANRTNFAVASLLGVAAGMAPDLDVLIRSSHDPLLALEFHRQFTHALAFIPFGGLICACVLYFLFARRHLTFKATYVFCLLGYATHALLDACTTYGTLLLWPFSDARIAWNVVSVIDPIFTLPAFALLILAGIKKRAKYSWCALAWMLAYLSIGQLQNHRALVGAEHLAAERGHAPQQLGVKPSFGNIVLWKSVYEYQGHYYIDAIRVLDDTEVIVGGRVAKLDLAQHFPWLNPESQQARDVQRFAWFSNQHLGLDPENPLRIVDIRYSLLPNEYQGMWGIELREAASADEHAAYNTSRPEPAEARNKLAQLWSMIMGRG